MAPILFLNRADPPVTKLLTVQRNSSQPFSIPLQSEDLGNNLVGHFWINFTLSGERILYGASAGVPAGTFDDVDRTFRTEWTVDLPNGCYQLTLIITQLDNVQPATLKPIDWNFAAMTSWWVAVGDSPNDLALADCPGAELDVTANP